MSAGKFQAGRPSANPGGRPTKEDALRRDLHCVQVGIGLEDFEFDALIEAMLTGKPEPLFVTIEFIHRRLYDDLLRCRAEPADDEEAPADDSFF